MKIPLFQVDAFTNELFKGNPAAVCPLDEWLSEDIMQNIATENNLPETAFFIKGKKGFHIRWFTPVSEIALCGHATMASAAVIFRKLGFQGDEIVFNSPSGKLGVKRSGDRLILDFPAENPVQSEVNENLARGLNITPLEWWKGKQDDMLVYQNEGEISSLKPDFNILKANTRRGLIVTAPGTQTDIVSRFFAPAIGIDEDPVTGSSHTLMTPYWAEKLGKNKLSAIQLSKRGGTLFCELHENRIFISGKVRFFLQGLITI